MQYCSSRTSVIITETHRSADRQQCYNSFLPHPLPASDATIRRPLAPTTAPIRRTHTCWHDIGIEHILIQDMMFVDNDPRYTIGEWTPVYLSRK